eukprot:4163501-Pyramimonas_sp.AAC.1
MASGRRQSGLLVHSKLPSGSLPLGGIAIVAWFRSRGAAPPPAMRIGPDTVREAVGARGRVTGEPGSILKILNFGEW